MICEEKHMGSRGLVIVCKTPEIAQSRFGMLKPSNGVCYTRTGRPFFKDETIEQTILEKLL